LHKTIVFITHDFDEAIRLADRIAIMHDGVIEQLGTAEELITNPATDYVAAFTKNVPRAKLLRVQTLMGPVDDAAEGEVDGAAKVATVARQILNAPGPVRVVKDGQVIGSVSGTQVADALFEND
jgi:glycine betaine/proline transport system ATP-binding protein